MKPCSNTDSTLLSATAEASDAQHSNAGSDARRNRILRHASDVGKSINRRWRFKLSPTLLAIIFGILPMLLLPSTARSQTVEELEQQISQLQAEKEGLQQANDAHAAEQCALVAQMSALDAEIADWQQIYDTALEEFQALIASQQAERGDLEQSIAGALLVVSILQGEINSLDPESETYEADLAFLNDEITNLECALAEIQSRLDEMDADLAQAATAALQASEVLQGLLASKAELQSEFDCLQSIIDSNNQRIQEIDSEIQSLQNEIDALNNM